MSSTSVDLHPEQDDWLFTYTASELQAFNDRAVQESLAIHGRAVAPIVSPVFDYNLFLMYGQSIGVGQECWPAKSLDSRPDILMFGDCVRSQHRGEVRFMPVGGPKLSPLKAVVQSKAEGLPMSAAAVAALNPGEDAFGESPLEGALKMARVQFLRSNPDIAAETRLFVGTNTAVAGRTIEGLSKGSQPNLYNRTVDAVKQIAAIAQHERKSIGLAALFYLQGEFNYTNFEGGTSDKAAYKALMARLYDDLRADVAGDSAELLPLITYQTGGRFTNATLSIGQAQLELSLEHEGWYLAAPYYPVTDKGGHLDANGSRWLGIQLGKVWHQVAVQRRHWRPLSPLRATWRGRHIVVEFHVPRPPLQFKPCYDRHNARMIHGHGFEVRDGHGRVTCTVRRVGSATILLSADRGFSGRIVVTYAGQSAGGLGNLCDSDDTVATDVYEMDADSGDYPSASIAELVGKPYPLWNWCVAFTMTAEHDTRVLDRPRPATEPPAKGMPVAKGQPAPKSKPTRPEERRSRAELLVAVLAAIGLLILLMQLRTLFK